MKWKIINSWKAKLVIFTALVVIILVGENEYNLNLFAEHKQEKKSVGVLMGSDLREDKVQGMIKGLEKYGYETTNVEFIILNAKDLISDLPGLAEELVKKNPDVLIGTGEKETLALQKATEDSSIPIVFIGVGSAKEIGLVQSYTNPGGNITGVDNYYLKLSGKRMEYFKRLIPEVHKISVLYDGTVTPAEPTIEFLNEVASELDLEITPISVENQQEAIEAVKNLNPENTNGLMLLCSLLMESVTDSISPILQEKMIPTFGVSENQTEKGFLGSYGMAYWEQGIQASRIVAKVLQGQNPGVIPIESPAKVDFIVNLEAIERFEKKIDPSGLACATKFIR